MWHRVLLSLLGCFFISGFANASVVLTGTRIVYPGNVKEKTIQFSNPDASPYLVQLAIGSQPNQTSENSPFLITPQFFRIQPNAGQAVRLTLKETTLPQDRESLFYLTFSQLPPMNRQQADANQLIMTITNQVKLFYRPAALAKQANDVTEGLTVTRRGNTLTVTNSSPFYKIIRTATLNAAGKKVQVAEGKTIAPHQSVDWQSAQFNASSADKVTFTLINDYGIDITHDLNL